MPKRQLPQDPAGQKFPGGTVIEDVVEVAITAAGFSAVTIPANKYCKAVYITTRDGADFLLSNISAGTTYATIPSGFAIDISAIPADVILYAKGTTSTDLEVILLN